MFLRGLLSGMPRDASLLGGVSCFFHELVCSSVFCVFLSDIFIQIIFLGGFWGGFLVLSF